MQNGSIIRRNRKRNSDIWQFRWWEKASDGKRIYRRRQIGTVDQIPDIETARKAASLLVPDLNARMAKIKVGFDDHRSVLQPFRTLRIMSDQHLAKLLNQEHLQGLLETMDHSEMERTPIERYPDHRGRILASKPSHREEHVRQDPQRHVSVVQSRLSVRVLRMEIQSDSSVKARSGDRRP